MKAERMIEILAEVTKLSVGEIRQDLTEPHSIKNRYIINTSEAITAMQRAVEEQTARLRECEAIVRGLAERPHRRGREQPHIIDYIPVIDNARQWVKNNPK